MARTWFRELNRQQDDESETECNSTRETSEMVSAAVNYKVKCYSIPILQNDCQ